jgi:hypothetical protein
MSCSVCGASKKCIIKYCRLTNVISMQPALGYTLVRLVIKAARPLELGLPIKQRPQG